MKTPFIALTLALLAGPLAAGLQAQEATTDVPNPNWFSVGPQFGLNINARFNHLGNVNPAKPGNYDDGFVHTDSSGNAGGQTWNWGYKNAGQVQGNSVVMHSSSASVNGSMDRTDDPQAGFDLAYGRNLGTVLGGKWGLQAAFDFTTVSIHDSRPLTGTGTTISDAYSLGGVTAPGAPYTGSFNGPGALLNDAPNRTTAAETVLMTKSKNQPVMQINVLLDQDHSMLANLLRDQDILEWAKREAAEFVANPPSKFEIETFVKYLRTEWPRRYGLAGVA